MAAGKFDDVTRVEVMRLQYLEGLSIRAIAKRLRLAKKTVRSHLYKGAARPAPPMTPRPSLLDPYETLIQGWLTDVPEMKATPVARAAPQTWIHRRGQHLARSRSPPSPARQRQDVPDFALRAGRGDADRLAGLRLRVAGHSPTGQRVRRVARPTRACCISSARSASPWPRSGGCYRAA
jgi:hypothetical protein